MSSDDDLMIRVRGLGKSYQIAHQSQRATTLAEVALQRLRSPFKRAERETFWALRDVSFDVRRGEVIGVIGRNGAGKSTLFKVLSRIAEPTTGQIDLFGRVGSLLEVGTGFSGELTGRENIFLNGTILGMRRAEIAKRFDEIVDFAGVDKFLDTPVKRYSSGMYVRLAFAVAAHMDPEILIVDEVLSVGDSEFQEKCLGRIRDVATGGRTVLFVSHNMNSIERLCTKAIVMSSGRLVLDGPVEAGVLAYQESFRGTAKAQVAPHLRPGSGEYRTTSVTPAKPLFDPAEPKVFDLTVERHQARTKGLFVILHVIDASGNVLALCDSRADGFRLNGEDSQRVHLRLSTPWLKPGAYRVDVLLDGTAGWIDRFENACELNVSSRLPYDEVIPDEATGAGVVLSDFSVRDPDRGPDGSRNGHDTSSVHVNT